MSCMSSPRVCQQHLYRGYGAEAFPAWISMAAIIAANKYLPMRLR